MVFGNHTLHKNSLPEREREIVILRVGWLRQAGYEFGQHRRIGLDIGLTEAEVEAVAEGADSPLWSDQDRLLLRAADELFAEQCLGDDTWAGLAAAFDTRQIMDLHFTYGNYTIVSMVLNSLGVQLDPGLQGLPAGPPPSLRPAVGKTTHRPARPRIPPLGAAGWDEETRHYINPMDEDEASVFNVFKTLANHPKLTKRWMIFATYILRKTSLPPRDRESAIVRIATLCGSDYEYGHHGRIARDEGVSEADIAAIVAGPDDRHWNPADAAMLRAVDELHGDSFIGDGTWAALCERYDSHQLLDFIFTVGNYAMLSTAMNSFGVALEDGFDRLPGVRA